MQISQFCLKLRSIKVSAKEPSPSNQIDNLDGADPQMHQSQLGNRKVPCELPCTPRVGKMPKIVGDAQKKDVQKKAVLWDPTTRCRKGSNTTKCDKGRDGSQPES